MMPDLIAALKEQLEYDQETGNFKWKVSKNGTRIGNIAGSNKDGYIQIICNQRQYRAHRIAWLLMNGSFPEKGFEIDHINGIRNDNRWSNLRLVNRAQNNMNSLPSKANKSGHRGVHFIAEMGKWHARIVINRKAILLGNFTLKEDAIKARREAEKKYFGEFTRGSK